ncbi:MAG: hypothetical protein GX270_09290 [Clostridiaceae bacterium]|nr:hypothetical protein [Clostridiaceae bacterium]
MRNFMFIVIMAIFFVVMASGCQTSDRESSDNNASAGLPQDNELKSPQLTTSVVTASISTAQPTPVEELASTVRPTPLAELEATAQPAPVEELIATVQPTASKPLDSSELAEKDIKATAKVSGSTNITPDKPLEVTPKATTTVEPEETIIETQPMSTMKIETSTPTPSKTPEVLKTPTVTCDDDVCWIIY